MWKLKLARYYIVGIALAGIIIPLIGGSISNEIAAMVKLMVVMLSVFLVTFPIVGIIYITSNKKQQSLSLIYFGISLAWTFLSFVAYKLYTTPIM